MTGIFDGTFRLSNNYRTQWGGITDPYTTIHVSADLPLFKSAARDSYWGMGLMVYSDKAGAIDFSYTIIEPSLSFTTPIDVDSKHYISLGLQAGLNSRSYDLTKATWASQYNGDVYDPRLPSGEAIQVSSLNYFDVNTGFMYYFVPDGYNSFYLSLGVQHLNKPNLSAFIDLKEDLLYKRYTAQTGAELSLNRDNTFWIVPKALVMLQGKQKEIAFGTMFKSKVQFKSKFTNFKKELYFSFGGFYRVADAVIPSVRLDYNNFGLGISYDVNASGLSVLAGGANSFEVSLSYIAAVKRGQRARNFNKMPRFF